MLPSATLNTVLFYLFCVYCAGYYIEERGGTVGRGTALQAGGCGFDSPRGPSGRTMALGSNQPLTEMSTRNISWG
jgi:hypothetical protein